MQTQTLLLLVCKYLGTNSELNVQHYHLAIGKVISIYVKEARTHDAIIVRTRRLKWNFYRATCRHILKQQ